MNPIETIIKNASFDRMTTPSHLKEVLDVYIKTIKNKSIDFNSTDFVYLMKVFFTGFLHNNDLDKYISKIGEICEKNENIDYRVVASGSKSLIGREDLIEVDEGIGILAENKDFDASLNIISSIAEEMDASQEIAINGKVSTPKGDQTPANPKAPQQKRRGRPKKNA